MDREMGDMNDVMMGRSPMRRARPLFLRLNAWRRAKEEAEVRPGRGRGAWGLVQQERIPGGRGGPSFLGRGRTYPAQGTPP